MRFVPPTPSPAGAAPGVLSAVRARGATFVVALAGAAIAAFAAAVADQDALLAQEASRTVYISAMQVGPRKKALVTIRNNSRSNQDVYYVRFTVGGPLAGAPLSAPAGGAIGESILPGHSITLDIGEIVKIYRKGQGFPTYEGQVEFTAYADGGVTKKFGPGAVTVTATQTEGAATYEPLMEWR